jgi:saccharopine dehydrogenase-like NADP-dependent oxidoreductase
MKTNKILILGGYGNTGRPLTRLLLQETTVDLILAGRSLSNAAATATEFNRQFPGERVSGRKADASNPDSLLQAFQGVDLVVVASSTARYARIVANAALQAGIDYLDIQFSTQKVNALKSLLPEIERTGRCFITDGGFHPGLPAFMIRYAASFFDRLQKANVGSVIKIDWASLNLPDDTLVELIEELNDFDPAIFRDGQWKKTNMLSTKGFLTMDFGEQFGKQTCAPMFLEELRSLPEAIPSLVETGFYVGSFNAFVDWFVMPLAVIALKPFSPQSRHHSVQRARMGTLKMIGKLMKWGLCTFSRPPYQTILKVDAQGLKNGQAKSLEVSLAHPNGYAFTAIPVAACLLQYLDGTIQKPGLWTQANLVEPQRMLQDMQRMGVEVKIQDSPTAFA